MSQSHNSAAKNSDGSPHKKSTSSQNSPHVDELLTVAEVAAYLKLSRRTAWRWCKSGRLPAVKIGHQWRIAKSDLEAFIHQRGNFAT